MAHFFFHGLESGPWGRKASALQTKFPHIQSPDFQGLDLEERLQKAKTLTEGMTGLVIVGSSFGGLVASLLATQLPERVAGLVLCAPALHLEQAARVDLQCPFVILHGVDDDVVPISASEAFVAGAKHGRLVRVRDDHRLSNSRAEIVDLTSQMIEDIAASDR